MKKIIILIFLIMTFSLNAQRNYYEYITDPSYMITDAQGMV